MTQTNRVNLQPASALVRIAGLTTLVALAVAAAGYFPTRNLAGSASVGAMFAGIGVALFGAWVGVAPTVLYLRKPPLEHANGILLGLLVRFMVTLGLAIAVWLAGWFEKAPLLIWVGLAQLIFLAVDVVGLVSLLKQAARDE